LINFKIYFIDDGSKDNTWNIIKTIYLDRYLKDIFVKLKFILFGIHRDGTLPDKNGNFENSIRFSLILSKSLFNLGILCSHVILFKNFKKIFLQKKEIFFLLLIILNLLTHIYLYELLPNI
jgi:glycosyltransferase involved in cell wall biosynthesis